MGAKHKLRSAETIRKLKHEMETKQKVLTSKMVQTELQTEAAARRRVTQLNAKYEAQIEALRRELEHKVLAVAQEDYIAHDDDDAHGEVDAPESDFVFVHAS